MPLVAIRASVREVLPWSYILDQEMSFKGHQSNYVRRALVYKSVSVSACEREANERVRTFLTSSAFR